MKNKIIACMLILMVGMVLVSHTAYACGMAKGGAAQGEEQEK